MGCITPSTRDNVMQRLNRSHVKGWMDGLVSLWLASCPSAELCCFFVRGPSCLVPCGRAKERYALLPRSGYQEICRCLDSNLDGLRESG